MRPPLELEDLLHARWQRLLDLPRATLSNEEQAFLAGPVETLCHLLEGIDAKVAEDTLIASNTSSIPLETLGQGLRHPERLVGLNFFNPVAKMQPSGSGVDEVC